MSIFAFTWIAMLLAVGCLLIVPLGVILLVSSRTRTPIVAAVKFLGWVLGCVALLALYRSLVVRSEITLVANTSDTGVRGDSHRLELALPPVTATKPDWLDQTPGMHGHTYSVAVKSGLWSTESECRQGLEDAVRAATADYLTNYFSDERAARLTSRESGGLPGQLVKQPIYAETVDASVGPMHQWSALVEFDDALRADMHRLWRQTFVADRLRYAAGGFSLVLAILAAVGSYLKIDLATGGRYTRRLRWASALAILLVAAGAVGMCAF